MTAELDRRDVITFVRAVTVAAFVGLLVGAVIGGVGGRLAMRVLAVTSDDSLQGAITDDQEEVGEITFGGTMGLIIFIGILGVALGLIYLLLRRWLPRSRSARALSFACLLWAIQGADTFDPDGFDFTQLEPRWLSVGMFTVILLAAGAMTAWGVEWGLEHWPEPGRRTWPAYLPLLIVVVLFPLLVPVAAVGVAAWIGRRYLRVAAWWGSQGVTVVGVVLLAALGLVFGIRTLDQIAEIVT
jgi:hypothetical protein